MLSRMLKYTRVIQIIFISYTAYKQKIKYFWAFFSHIQCYNLRIPRPYGWHISGYPRNNNDGYSYYVSTYRMADRRIASLGRSTVLCSTTYCYFLFSFDQMLDPKPRPESKIVRPEF
jgi:hypothetical protein